MHGKYIHHQLIVIVVVGEEVEVEHPPTHLELQLLVCVVDRLGGSIGVGTLVVVLVIAACQLLIGAGAPCPRRRVPSHSTRK